MSPRQHPSPNHGPRPAGVPVDVLIIHYTQMASAAAALARLADPDAQVSAHYLIEEDGTVWQLVPEDRRAWHAGLSSWAGETDVNGRSIGIELQHPGHALGYRPFAPAQMTALTQLAAGLLARHPIPPWRVLGHADVAPLRKDDPGELFDWAGLARAGVGLWPFGEPGGGEPAPGDVAAAQRLLAEIGYATPRTGRLDPATVAVLRAFQRHFRPARVDGRLDRGTAAQIAAVRRAVGRPGAALSR